MDYTSAPLFFRIRKAARYARLYGLRRTLVKIRGQYHMARRYDRLPPNHVRTDSAADVGLIGCGNYGYSVIAYYLQKNFGNLLRGCMDIDVNKAASLFEDYKACYYTTDADEIIADPRIRLVFIASNHASHAEYAIRVLRAGKDVHIEKPHVVSEEQLERLCMAMQESQGRVVSIGYNRPGSLFGRRIKELLWREQGELMQNWFVAGHEIAPDHWYFRDEEGGRVLGNLCHWTDLIYQMMPADRRYPIKITPTRSSKSDCDIAVTYLFGDGSIAAITFSAKGHAFEGVKERYAAHRGSTLIAMDDFKTLTADVGPGKSTWTLPTRDHGHDFSIRGSYEQCRDAGATGLSSQYVRESAQLFLQTRNALESSVPIVVSGRPDTVPTAHARKAMGTGESAPATILPTPRPDSEAGP
jgi:predicted dehydrogenase